MQNQDAGLKPQHLRKTYSTLRLMLARDVGCAQRTEDMNIMFDGA
ncbi:hypothetical protein [Psychrobacter jeotgali]|nr:hypothetical protein [Psychrobacter jeotgali]